MAGKEKCRLGDNEVMEKRSSIKIATNAHV